MNGEQAILDAIGAVRTDVHELRAELAKHNDRHANDAQTDSDHWQAMERRVTRVETGLKVRSVAGGVGVVGAYVGPLLLGLFGVKSH